MPFAMAAKQFNVPRNNLKRRVLEKNRDAVDEKKILGKFRHVFTEDKEKELCQHIKKNNIPNTFNEEKRWQGKIR